jgi:hypothetical protein
MMECLLKSDDYDIYEQYTIADNDGYNVLALLVNLNYGNSIIKLFEYLNEIGEKNLKKKYFMRKGDLYVYVYVYVFIRIHGCIYAYVNFEFFFT